jgi:hypothetical protein
MSVLGKSMLSTVETPICKALKHSTALSKDCTGIHSDRGLPGSDGGNTSKYLGADPDGSTSGLAWNDPSYLLPSLPHRPKGETVARPVLERFHRFQLSPL